MVISSVNHHIGQEGHFCLRRLSPFGHKKVKYVTVSLVNVVAKRVHSGQSEVETHSKPHLTGRTKNGRLDVQQVCLSVAIVPKN